jgi:hypothetical protein
MLSPSSLSGGRKYTKRIRFKDDEDSDGTLVSKTKRKKRPVEALQAKAPSATLDAIALLPHEQLNNSTMVTGSDYTPNGTPSGKPKRKPELKHQKRKHSTLQRYCQMRPRAWLSRSAQRSASGRLLAAPVNMMLSIVVELGGEAIGHTRPRVNTKADVVNEIDSTRSPGTEEAVSQKKEMSRLPEVYHHRG